MLKNNRRAKSEAAKVMRLEIVFLIPKIVF